MQIVQELRSHIEKILDILKIDLGTIRTGRATPALVENIVVSVYGGSTKLKVMEVATVGTTDPQTLVITPYDNSIIAEIQKGIVEANTGLNPVNEGQLLRISLPPLSQERREELIKLMKTKLENGRIMIRQARHEAMEEIKKLKDEKTHSEDEITRLEKDVQKIVDDTMETIDTLGKQKEHDLMQI